MDCDHRDPITKLGDPSNMARNGSEAALDAELLKCDVVCSNCHRKRNRQVQRELATHIKSLQIPFDPLQFVVLSIQKGALSGFKDPKCLLAIFEDEWTNKQDLVKAMIRHRLGVLGTKLRASKLDLRRLDTNAHFESFFERNHLDGHARASYAYGLFLGDKLISCLSVRTNHQGEREIARLATDYNYHVYGGAGRLVKAALREEGKLITFSNNRLSVGDVYRQLGFTLVQENKPSYWYTDGVQRIWRFRCRRINDPAILAQFPEIEHTEKAQAAGGVFSSILFGDRRPLWRVADYGHRKWSLRIL
jgi:hypothetical protein